MADILHAIQISSPVDSVFALVSSAKGFSSWWAEDVSQSDAIVELAFFNRKTLYRLRLAKQTPPAHIDWLCESGAEWQGTHIIFDLRVSSAATSLRFYHAGWNQHTDYMTSCNTTWGELMFRLKAAAEGHSRGPLFLASSLAY
jgi:hypothetical protein